MNLLPTTIKDWIISLICAGVFYIFLVITLSFGEY